MPRAVFLLPGIGAQGGRVEDLAPAFAPGRAAGLVTSSRSIVVRTRARRRRSRRRRARRRPSACGPPHGRLRDRLRRRQLRPTIRRMLRRPARIFAPLALVAVRRRGARDREPHTTPDSGGSSSTPAQTSTLSTTSTSKDAAKKPRRRYIVKPGDVLSAIAIKTGVPLDTLIAAQPQRRRAVAADRPEAQARAVTWRRVPRARPRVPRRCVPCAAAARRAAGDHARPRPSSSSPRRRTSSTRAGRACAGRSPPRRS